MDYVINSINFVEFFKKFYIEYHVFYKNILLLKLCLVSAQSYTIISAHHFSIHSSTRLSHYRERGKLKWMLTLVIFWLRFLSNILISPLNCGWKSSHILTLTSSREACTVALQTPRPKVITQDGLELKLPNEKCDMVGSHVLGLQLPWQRSVFIVSEPAHCPSVSKITCLRNVGVIPLFPESSGHNLPPEHKTMDPLIVFLLPKYPLCV